MFHLLGGSHTRVSRRPHSPRAPVSVDTIIHPLDPLVTHRPSPTGPLAAQIFFLQLIITTHVATALASLRITQPISPSAPHVRPARSRPPRSSTTSEFILASFGGAPTSTHPRRRQPSPAAPPPAARCCVPKPFRDMCASLDLDRHTQRPIQHPALSHPRGALVIGGAFLAYCGVLIAVDEF